MTELLVVDEPFREAVLKKTPTSALEEIAIQRGMKTILKNGVQRVVDGQTPLDEMIRVLAADLI